MENYEKSFFVNGEIYIIRETDEENIIFQSINKKFESKQQSYLPTINLYYMRTIPSCNTNTKI